MLVFRADIFLADIPKKDNYAHQVNGVRPIIIVSNDKCNKYSPVLTYMPCVIKDNIEKHPIYDEWLHVEISKESGLKKDSIALCEYTDSIPRSCLIKHIGKLNYETMRKIDFGLARHFDVEGSFLEQIDSTVRLIKDFNRLFKEYNPVNREVEEFLTEQKNNYFKMLLEDCNNDINLYKKVLLENDLEYVEINTK